VAFGTIYLVKQRLSMLPGLYFADSVQCLTESRGQDLVSWTGRPDRNLELTRT
jgi:hypothetical protein